MPWFAIQTQLPQPNAQPCPKKRYAGLQRVPIASTGLCSHARIRYNMLFPSNPLYSNPLINPAMIDDKKVLVMKQS
jgi:hypothetical protein